MNVDKFTNDQPDEKPFHSSLYAEAAHGGSIGSTNSQTFGQRNAADQSRTFVRKYRDSHIGRGALRHHARKGITTDSYVHIDPVAPTSLQALNATDTPSGITPPPSSIATPPARSSFREPPTRGFNPYS